MVATRRAKTSTAAVRAEPAPRTGQVAKARANTRAKQQAKAIADEAEAQAVRLPSKQVTQPIVVSPKKTRSGRARVTVTETAAEAIHEDDDEPESMEMEPEVVPAVEPKKKRGRPAKRLQQNAVSDADVETDLATITTQEAPSSPIKTRALRSRTVNRANEISEPARVPTMAKKPLRRTGRGRPALAAKQDENAGTPLKAANASPEKQTSPVKTPQRGLMSPSKQTGLATPKLIVYTSPSPMAESPAPAAAVHETEDLPTASPEAPVVETAAMSPVLLADPLADAEKDMTEEPATTPTPTAIVGTPTSVAPVEEDAVSSEASTYLPTSPLTTDALEPFAASEIEAVEGPMSDVADVSMTYPGFFSPDEPMLEEPTPLVTQAQFEQTPSPMAVIQEPAGDISILPALDLGGAADQIFDTLDEMALAPNILASPFKMPALLASSKPASTASILNPMRLRMSPAKLLGSPSRRVLGTPATRSLGTPMRALRSLLGEATPAGSGSDTPSQYLVSPASTQGSPVKHLHRTPASQTTESVVSLEKAVPGTTSEATMSKSATKAVTATPARVIDTPARPLKTATPMTLSPRKALLKASLVTQSPVKVATPKLSTPAQMAAVSNTQAQAARVPAMAPIASITVASPIKAPVSSPRKLGSPQRVRVPASAAKVSSSARKPVTTTPGPRLSPKKSAVAVTASATPTIQFPVQARPSPEKVLGSPVRNMASTPVESARKLHISSVKQASAVKRVASPVKPVSLAKRQRVSQEYTAADEEAINALVQELIDAAISGSLPSSAVSVEISAANEKVSQEDIVKSSDQGNVTELIETPELVVVKGLNYEVAEDKALGLPDQKEAVDPETSTAAPNEAIAIELEQQVVRPIDVEVVEQIGSQLTALDEKVLEPPAIEPLAAEDVSQFDSSSKPEEMSAECEVTLPAISEEPAEHPIVDEQAETPSATALVQEAVGGSQLASLDDEVVNVAVEAVLSAAEALLPTAVQADPVEQPVNEQEPVIDVPEAKEAEVTPLSSDPLEAAVEAFIDNLAEQTVIEQMTAADEEVQDQAAPSAQTPIPEDAADATTPSEVELLKSSPIKRLRSSPVKVLKQSPAMRLLQSPKRTRSSPRNAAAAALPASSIKAVKQDRTTTMGGDESQLSIGSALELSFIGAKDQSLNLDFSPVKLTHNLETFSAGTILESDVSGIDSQIALSSSDRSVEQPAATAATPVDINVFTEIAGTVPVPSASIQAENVDQSAAEESTTVVTSRVTDSVSAASPVATPSIQAEDLKVDEVASSSPPKKQKRSNRRQSRRQSYMTATKTAVREREEELAQQQAQRDAADEQLLQEAEAEAESDQVPTASLLVEMPGSVERKRTKRRSSMAAKSPLSQMAAPQVSRADSVDSAEVMSPIVLKTVATRSLDACATKIQALFRGWRERKLLQNGVHVEQQTAQEETQAADEVGDITVEDCPSTVVAALEQQADQMTKADGPKSSEATSIPVSQSGHDLNAMVDDFLKSYKTKKSLRAKESTPALPSSPVKPTQHTPGRTVAGALSPQKGDVRPITMPVLAPSSVQKPKSRLSRSAAPATKIQLPTVNIVAAASGPSEKLRVRIPASKRGIPVLAKSSSSSMLATTSNSPVKAPETDRKRKEAPVAETAGPLRKRVRAASTSALSAPMRSKTPPAVVLGVRSAPTTPKRLLYLTPAEVTKTTRNFTSQNRLYRCDFERVVVHKDIPRPASPPPKLQAKQAQNARVKRRKLTKEKGYTFGAGDDESYQPRNVTPTRKSIKWSEALEVDLLTLPRTSPSKAALLAREVNSCIAPLILDDFGNVEGVTPLTPIIGPPPTVVVKKILYKGEVDE